MSNQPDWMSDPLVEHIPKKKLEFLGEVFRQGQGKNQKQLSAYLIPLLKKAREEHLTFTPDEMQAAFAAIKKHSTIEECEKIDQLLQKTRTNTSAD